MKPEEPSLVHLDLRAPLEYESTPGLDPFACLPAADEPAPELLFRFELEREQAQRIDPAAEHFLGELVFSGTRKDGQGEALAPGLYLFVQRRGTLDREHCIALAIEQQKDGLWERLCLENHLYIRRLFEDGSSVTQLFRPYHKRQNY